MSQSSDGRFNQMVTLERAYEIAHNVIKHLENSKFDMIEAYAGLKLVITHLEKVCDIKGMEISSDSLELFESDKKEWN